eukprot:CAMPEP_0171744432 /NCGR_PEP_ID=MMETSP0991-20121206/37505_1 /TAXON_ID=483369 /ORGANISM="non described non described, Strain CCMP2098" /LENGTH=582 /DNA_ID=CAMNT_0012343599 /DNA_START=9 /DNA_END=1755 /DNA_ORIENTATION=-
MIAAGKDLINFVMILLILLFGFSIIGHLLFGHVLFEYSTVSSSFETAVLNSIGIFDYPEMVEASGNLAAAIYFFTFVFIITMVVMQMVIASVEDMCNGGDWINFPRLAKLEEDLVFNSALCLLMSTLLIFKFLTPFPKFGIFVHTMLAAGKDLVNFVIILLILLFGFSIIGHLLFGHVLFKYSTVSSSFETAVLNSIGIFDYPEMVEASGNLAAAIYFFTFVFIITMVVMQMVIAIIFSAYDGLREQIDEAEELEIGPTLIRRVVLGRDPSLKELEDPLLDLTKHSFRRLFVKWGTFLSKRTLPKDAVGSAEGSSQGERVTPDTFGDAHLLQLFDPQHVFRMYGILSPKLENEIVNAKVCVAKESEITVSSIFKSRISGRASGEEDKDAVANDSWALNLEEFCVLVGVLDVKDNALHITGGDLNGASDGNAMRIAHHIFTAYGRRHQNIAGDRKFRKRVIRKIDKLTKLCGPTEVKNAAAQRTSKVPSNGFLSAAPRTSKVVSSSNPLGLGSFIIDSNAETPSEKRKVATGVANDARNVMMVNRQRKQAREYLLQTEMAKPRVRKSSMEGLQPTPWLGYDQW